MDTPTATVIRHADPTRPSYANSRKRAAITGTRFDLGEVDVAGTKPHMLFLVRNYCASVRKQWRQCLLQCEVFVAETIPVGEPDSHGHHRMLWVRVVGMPWQLESVASYSCVEKWQYVLNGSVPLGEKLDEGGVPYVLKVKAQGGGEPKHRTPCPTMQNVRDLDDTQRIVSYPGRSPRDKKASPVSATQGDSMRVAAIASDNTSFPKPISPAQLLPASTEPLGYTATVKTPAQIDYAKNDLRSVSCPYPQCDKGSGI